MKVIFVPLFFLGLIISITAVVTFKRGDTMAFQKKITTPAIAESSGDAKEPVKTEMATFALG